MAFATSLATGTILSLFTVWVMRLPPLYFCVLLFLSLNAKMLPLVSTFRVLPSLARIYLWPAVPKRAALFEPYSISSHACFMECDANIHKSNSTYLLDLDVSRAELLTRLFSYAQRRTRSQIILAGVDVSFRREIRPLQAYDTRSCLLTWDEKWIYVLSYHVKSGAVVEDSDDWIAGLLRNELQTDSKRRLVFAVAISKYVAKAGRRTVPPAQLLKASGFLEGDKLADKKEVDEMERKRTGGLILLQGK